MSWSALRGALAALCLYTVALAPFAAHASINTKVEGSEPRGFGRIVLTFDVPTKVQARVSNGILILDFSEPIDLSRQKLAEQLPDYVAIVRLDPDGKALRLAMIQPVRPHVMEAAERTFIDLLPPSWTGEPPPLPQEVVDELARRAQVAEKKLRKFEEEQPHPKPGNIEVRVADLPTLHRIVLAPSKTVPIAFHKTGHKATLTFSGAMNIDKPALLMALPKGVSLTDLKTSPDSLMLDLAFTKDADIEGFREDDNYVLDVAKPKKPAMAGTAEPALTSETPKAGDITATSETAKTAAALAKAMAAPETQAPSATQTDPMPTASMAQDAPAQPASSVKAASHDVPGVHAKPADTPAPMQAASGHPGASSQAAASNAKGMSQGGEPVVPVVKTNASGVSILFPYHSRTAAAAFQDDGHVTLVFESTESLDTSAFENAAVRLGPVARTHDGLVTTLRFSPPAPALLSLVPEQNGWRMTYGDNVDAATTPLKLTRALDNNGRNVVEADLPDISGIHWIESPSGERIAVATAFGAPRSLPTVHRYLEFEALKSAYGLAVAAIADDLTVRPGIGKVIIGKASGLNVSIAPEGQAHAQPSAPPVYVVDHDEWMHDRGGVTRDRERELMTLAARARPADKAASRLKLAQFLLANHLAVEAAGVLDVIAGDNPKLGVEPKVAVLRAIAAFQLHRNDEARRILDLPSLADNAEAALWRAAVQARQRRWAHALVGFRTNADVIEAYPDDLQRELRTLAVRAALAQKDFPQAEREMAGLARLDKSPNGEAALLRARLDDLSGNTNEALTAYDRLAKDGERPIAARAMLYGTTLALKAKKIAKEEARARFETLSMIWRGGHVEASTLEHLVHLYADFGQWRQAFRTTRMADQYLTDDPVTTRLHDFTAQKFEELFLTGKADTLGRLESLALYYDFKELTPPGRRGDEIVRRLADRLVSLDLLDQAADLLQHQVDHRLTGAARASVAAKLAMIRLMTNKPDMALAVLQDTRLPELPQTVKRARLLLEARALSDLSRTDLALEMLDGEKGLEVNRLRADILWQGRRWREAGEAEERLLGDAWHGNEPLSAHQRTEVIRAAIAYVLAKETIGLDRLRSKFAAKMADSPDAGTFAFLAGKPDATNQTFRDLASTVTSADTLADFLDAYRKRYPETSVSAPPRAATQSQGARGQGSQGQAQAAATPARG